ncbi:MAG: translation initiation factor IF-6 [Candidatus Micrarchaeota archaeon]|nr:translation initiation factor IF-6 [Candidatus Micrarchaeota archaeon]
MKLKKVDFNRDPNIGLYSFATDSYVLCGIDNQADFLSEFFGAPVITERIMGTELAGLFCAGNSGCVVIPSIAEASIPGLSVLRLETRFTALGNLILCNDNGCVISPLLSEFEKTISDFMGCEVVSGTIGGFKTVGALAVANNRGCVCSSKVTEEEKELLSSVLKVKIGEVSETFIKSCVVVNSRGVLVSDAVRGGDLDVLVEVFE